MTHPYNASVPQVMPDRIRRLPVSPAGWPIPFFACKDPLDFRVVQPGAWATCHNQKRCWVCGEPLGRTFAFTIGPMCAINRTTSEPPSHRECAEWSAQVCPFLTRPKMKRNEKDLPEDRSSPGFALRRNPGVALVWVTRGYEPFRVPGGGVLIEIGEPLELLWFAEGRPATRAEVQASIESGLPALQELCEAETTERERIAARQDLAARCAWAAGQLPAEAVSTPAP